MRPKTFAVLRYLVEHPGQLVTKEEVLDVVWTGTVVSDTVLKSCIRELREALGDDVQRPRFITTVHRRGYRFVGNVASSQHSVVGSGKEARDWRLEARSSSPQVPSLKPLAPRVVGREAELTQLHSLLATALHGERQLVFVTGEAGIGKTTLVEAFLRGFGNWEVGSGPLPSSLPNPHSQIPAPGVWLGRGQCIEQYGAGEAYMPILEALSRLCREPGGERLIALLSHHAPTWLVQMPTLLDAGELEVLQRKVQDATRERMLREMAEAIDVVTAERPLVLWLEDLHWSDASTLELLALLARRRERARLLVLGTYRPVDVIVNEHPLKTVKQELLLHGQCQELSVRSLSEEAIAEYLAVRFDRHARTREAAPLQDLARTIHQRTEGNPLFTANIVDELLARGKIDNTVIESSTPATIRAMIEQQFERLSAEEQRVLEVASVAGMEFSAATVAAGTQAATDEVEQLCTALARRGQFLQAKGTDEWPDGTIATRYGFLHALYQEVMYERVPMRRRVNFHHRIGERMEAAYGDHTKEIATELALHFDYGREYEHAIHYLQLVAENAARRCAHREAVRYLNRAVALLPHLSDGTTHTQCELRLQAALGAALMVLKGTAAPEVEIAYLRARELCQRTGETVSLFPIVRGLFASAVMRGKLMLGQEHAEQLLHLAQSQSDSVWLAHAYLALGMTEYRRGKLITARDHLERGRGHYEPGQHYLYASQYGGADPGVSAHCFQAWTLWHLGYADQALSHSHAAITLAQKLPHPYSLAFALNFAAWVHKLRHEAANESPG